METLSRGNDSKVRERLLRVALELFTTKGYAAATVREIVAAAGVTKPVLYYYFKNKEGIYLELLQNAYGPLAELLDEAGRDKGTAKKRTVRLAERMFDLFMEKIDIVRVIYSVFYGPPQGAPFFDFAAYQLRLRGVILQIVEDGIRNGELRQGEPRAMMAALLGAIHVAMESQLCGDPEKIERNELLGIINVIFDGLAAYGDKHLNP